VFAVHIPGVHASGTARVAAESGSETQQAFLSRSGVFGAVIGVFPFRRLRRGDQIDAAGQSQSSSLEGLERFAAELPNRAFVQDQFCGFHDGLCNDFSAYFQK